MNNHRPTHRLMTPYAQKPEWIRVKVPFFHIATLYHYHDHCQHDRMHCTIAQSSQPSRDLYFYSSNILLLPLLALVYLRSTSVSAVFFSRHCFGSWAPLVSIWFRQFHSAVCGTTWHFNNKWRRIRRKGRNEIARKNNQTFHDCQQWVFGSGVGYTCFFTAPEFYRHNNL